MQKGGMDTEDELARAKKALSNRDVTVLKNDGSAQACS